MIQSSQRLQHVSYEIRGPVLERAQQLEQQGQSIIRLNIGNPAPFGLTTPPHLLAAIAERLPEAQGYTQSRGLPAARVAIAHYAAGQGIADVGPDDIFVGNGVSEMIMMALQGLLNDGDEVLIPAPDYPLWTSAVHLAGGRAVHYRCDESAQWWPDVADVEARITPRTRALVIINPNNPTGAVYPPELLGQLADVAVRHGLLLFSDEIYDQILYDGAAHTSIASLTDEVLCLTLGGLSKNYRAAGLRAGWLIVSGPRHRARGYLSGLETLASMRLCGNVTAQLAVEAALTGHPCIRDLVLPTGRLCQQRDVVVQMLNALPGVSCTVPQGSFYVFPRLDPAVFGIVDDRQFALDLLEAQRVLVVAGSGFNWPTPDHFRIVFLPEVAVLTEAIARLGHFLADYRPARKPALVG